MKKLSQEKRNQLIITVGSTVVVLGLIYFFLISAQINRIAAIKRSQKAAETKLADIEKTNKKSETIGTDLSEANFNLARAEADIASGDIYAWTYDFIRRFKSNYQVDIPSISPPSLGPVDILPDFPYRQIKISLNGTAYYHNFGKFVSDLENTFPHVRVVNLSLEPGVGNDSEKLNFRIDVIALVKSNS